MKRPQKFAGIAALALAGSLSLAACGSDDDGKSNADDEAGKTAQKGDGVFTVGELLPQTGDLAFLGPPEFAGVKLAVDEINEAGGVLGKPVTHVRADSGDGTPDIASAEVDKLLSAKSDVIVGAAASGVSITVIDKITGAGVVQFSPANTAAGFDTDEVDPNGLYFRTSPSDYLQGEILANLVVEDGHQNVAVMARQDFYGEGLAERAKEVLEEKGASVPEFILYNADAQNFTAEINKVAAAKPDALILVGFNETTKIIPALTAQGVGPQDIGIYFTDGNLADYSKESFNLTGVKGTAPMPAEPDAEFTKKLKASPLVSPDDVLLYGPESYDAVIISALAAIAAGDDSGESVAEHIVDVTREGEQCSTFADCKALLEDGKDIDYQGKSGPTDMTDVGSIAAQQRGPDRQAGPSLLGSLLAERAEVELDHLRVLGQRRARPGVGVAPLVEDVGAVADLQAAGGVLLHHHDGDPGPVDVPGLDEHLVLHDGREAGRRLVEEQHGRLHHQRATHGDHLSLATRERSGALLAPVEERREQVADELEALLEALRALVGAHLEVLLDRQRREDVVGLRDESHALGHQDVGALVGDVVAMEDDGARVDLHQPEERLEQGGLARAVGADDADQLALLAVQVSAVEDVDAGQVAGDQVVGTQDRTLGTAEVLLAARHGGLVARGHGWVSFASAEISASTSAETFSSISVRSWSWCAPR
jgi:ABC-type branched-subunit amino acid transport system substrate-binding protein